MIQKEGVNKKFLFLFIFLIATAAILLYARLNYTGYVVENPIINYTSEADCLAANYNWRNITELQNQTVEVEVVTGGTCSDENYTSEADCIAANFTWTNITELQNQTVEVEVVVNGTCFELVQECSDDLTLCVNEGDCTSEGGYWYNDTCNEEEVASCVEDWVCTEWSDSANNCGTRTCEDANDCGTTNDARITSKECPKIKEEDFVKVAAKTCTPNWKCDEVWGKCVDGVQERTCIDTNSCNSSAGMPATSQSCTVELTLEEKCSDGIKNYDETGIDCGGSCEKKCSFFTIAGSAVSGTLDAVVIRGMFGSVLRIILSITVLVLVIGGVVVARLAMKKKLDLSFVDKAISSVSSFSKRLFRKRE